MPERIPKLLAQSGIGSRREIERWIEASRLKCNGEVVSLGQKGEWHDEYQLDGESLTLNPSPIGQGRVLLYHKQEGELCTRSDPQGRPTVFHSVPPPKKGRWINVGRLDINSSGLLLLMTDGELAHRLMHPSVEIEREYRVRAYGKVGPDMIKAMCEGIEDQGEKLRCHSIKALESSGKNQWYSMVLTEGKNREIRRLFEAFDCSVSRLLRVRYGPIVLEREQPEGSYRELAFAEIQSLYKAAGLPAPKA